MLDIRAVAYITPLSEVDFAPVPLTVRLVNYADETGLVSAGFRIYNSTTGLLIYQSDIIPVAIAKGATVDVSALTDFMPPAPADQVYFVVFDGVAANDLVPDGITLQLGAFYFDVKPAPLGPIPAGHAVTHEDTGIDEVDVTGLTGLLADPQTPILHHLEHETGGGDEVNVTGLAGELADDQPPKAHDNAAHTVTFEDQANKGVAGGYCGLPNPLDSTLPLRADGKAAQPLGYFASNDLVNNTYHPWVAAAIGGGSIGALAASANHPGVRYVESSATPNSGANVLTASLALILAGNESSDLIFQPRLLAGTTIRFGYLDTTTSSDAVDGVYIEMAQVAGVDGTIVGKSASNSTRSTTGTSFLLITATWYRLRATLNAAATRIDFYLYSEAGALLWTDNLTTDIPTAAGRETGHGVIVTNSAGSIATLAYLDYIDNYIGRAFTR
jgi:hypothetical protein